MIKNIISGLLKGGTLDIFSFIKQFKNLKGSEAEKFLDVNGDGKVDFQDIKALQIETVFKAIGFLALMYVVNNFDKIVDKIF